MDHLTTTFQSLYEAFNRRDIDAVLAMMNEEVDWPHAWKGGRLSGREAVRGYWTAQWAENRSPRRTTLGHRGCRWFCGCEGQAGSPLARRRDPRPR